MLTRDTELANWLVNAFNGEWLKFTKAVPNGNKKVKRAVHMDALSNV